MKTEKHTIHQLQTSLRCKEFSSVELTKYYLERIAKHDGSIESYLTICEEQALAAAEAADRRIAEGETDPLLGIPVGIKDNICTKGIPTTCASKMLKDFVPPYDAFVIRKLKEQGAVILGKLNMDEFAMGSSTENSYFLKTKNPHDLSRVPGGSSGGSAASVAADLAVYSLGSDTGGSIRQPAAFCGTVGLKPTYGLVSRFGLIAFASSLDQIGLFTKDVEDCAIALQGIAGYDHMDSTSAQNGFTFDPETWKEGIRGMKIGIPREYLENGIQPEIRVALDQTAELLKDCGAEWEICSLPLTKYALPVYYLISSAEASSNLARYDGIQYGYRAEDCADLGELYERSRSEGFGSEVKRRIMLGTYALSSGYYDAYYKRAQQARIQICADFDSALERFDLLLTPTTPTTAYRFGEKADPISMYMGDICTVAVNVAGLPAISIPAGKDGNGLPIGMQLIGGRFSEAALLRCAHSLETAFADQKKEGM